MIKFIVTFSFLMLILNRGNAQQLPLIEKADSTNGYEKHFHYGVGNLLSLANPPVGGYTPQFNLEYGFAKVSGFQWAAGMAFRYASGTNGNLRIHAFLPLMLYLSAERKYVLGNNFYLMYGGKLVFSSSTRYSRLSSFQADDIGIGVAISGGLGWALKSNLSIFIKESIGVGMYRNFAGVGTITVPTVQFGGFFPEHFIVGVRHYF